MASLNVNAPDGKTLTVQVPEGTDPKDYGSLADDALSHYSSKASPESEGAIGSFFRAAGNQMPLGPQFSALVGKGNYSDNMAALNNVTAQDKANHPMAYGAGAVTGAVAPAAIPGVGEAMAANPATTGALLGGTNAIANTDLKQHPILGAAQAVGGAASGAMLSKVLSMIMPSQATLEAKSNTLANKSVNMPSGVLEPMSEGERQAQGSMLRDAGIIVKDKQVALDKAKGLLNDYGKKIGQIGNTAEGQELTADPTEHYSAITNLINKAQEFAGSENKVSKAIGRDYKAGATDIANLGDNPSWDAIQSLKEKYGQFAFKDTATQGAKDTYFALSNMLKGIADKAQASPSLGAQYKEALSGYSSMSPVVDGLKDAVDSELRGGGAGMGVRGLVGAIRKMPGSARAVVGAGALATGHPYYAGMAAIPELMNPAIQSQAAGGLASAMPTIQNLATIGASKGSSNPDVQGKIIDLIQQLKQKYDQRRAM